jgi:hypothetical protein
MDEFETIDIPADLLAVFQEYDYGNGALRYGWKTKAMQAVATAKGISFKGDNRKVLEQELGKYVELYKSGEF